MRRERQPARANALARLIHPLGNQHFLEHVWAKSSRVVRGKLRRMSEISDLPELRSVDELLTHVERAGDKVSVRAWFPDTQGRHESISLTAAAAKRLYRAGNATIVVDNVDRVSPEIRQMLDELQQATGTPGIASCNVYASPPGVRTVMHFDPQDSFFLQVLGKKRWRYAENTQLPFPAKASNYYENVPSEREIARTFPKRMPQGAKEVVLSPGSVLYLTRGIWHEATAVSHSLSLTLTFASKTWCEVIMEELEERLSGQVAWRKPAVGVLGDGDAQKRAGVVLEDMLAKLRDEVLEMGGFPS